MKELEKLNNYIEHFHSELGLYVVIDRQALHFAFDLCKGSDKLEIGGVITGFYSKYGTTCHVRCFHPPTSDSKRGTHLFENGILGLAEKLKSLWQKQEYYLGEWHYHPHSSPSPSLQDKAQLKEISSSRSSKCKFPLMLIVGENTDGNFCYSLTGYNSKDKYISFK